MSQKSNNNVPDLYEETRNILNIPTVLNSASTSIGDPFLVRHSRRMDRRVKQNAHLMRIAKRAVPLLKQFKKTSSDKKATQLKKAVHSTALPKDLPRTISLPKPPKNVDVSIIIPVYNKMEVTLACLASLSRITPHHSYEVIIVDNASSDGTEVKLPKMQHLVYVRSEENLGFVDGCNLGASKAKGETLVFLNNDTIVTESWLDNLVSPLTEEGIGLVGSKLLYPNGSLQEAGGIIFRDASGMNYGKYQDPDYYQFNYRREVDYCSGASIAIRASLFKEIGGFDRLYAPAYYEDTDLAFSVRKRGLKVIYEPSSIAYHIEGKTAGTSINSGFKKFQAINHEKFLKKWGKTLKSEHCIPEEWYLGRDRSNQKLALIIEDRVPTPDKDSGSQRMVRLISDLQALGYKITYWPNDLIHVNHYTESLQKKGVEVVYGDIDFVAFSRQFGRYYDLVLMSRPYVAAKYIEACRAWFYKASLIYDTVDLHFLRTERQAETEPAIADGLLDQARHYRALEIGIARRADYTLTVSELEKRLLMDIDPSVSVAVVSNIHEINDYAYNVKYEDRKDLLFIGGFDHAPNQDAVKWFATEIFPSIKEKIPGIVFHIVGANMEPPLRSYLESKDGVKVHGYVADISDIFSKTRVFVSPLRFGAGVKGKIGQAIEFGIPVVSTKIGAEGMHLKDDVSAAIADTPETFASKTINLYNNRDDWSRLQQNARETLRKYFSHESALSNLRKITD